ncbi:uncharacterized protein LOC124550748 [Schistocerca americana]|uniref:uncharacterized protein LOC124550748 n=1 Tax=Schistocerca americana TaxID=7009 RepID=UPI001F4FD56C|nr:uncharacterized protein LOC124550748 [Schistocerca americana]
MKREQHDVNDVALQANKKDKQISSHDNRRGPRCYNYNKYGHIAINSRSKNKATEKSVIKETSYKTFFMMPPSTKTIHKDWFVDSGASAHMSHHPCDLNFLASFPSLQVVVANNQNLPVKGRGCTHIKSVAGREKINIKVLNVLYVPQLGTNLLSVSKIVQQVTQSFLTIEAVAFEIQRRNS